MKRIRIGKDISMRWEITTDGVAIPLEGRDLTIEIKSPAGIENNMPYRVDGNILIMTYYGYEQKRTGEYSITLWEKKGKPGQNVVDVIRAFELVRTSQEEDDFVGGDLQIESVDLGTENFDILTEGGYRAINIDTLQAEALEDSVNIKGKTYSNESFTITLPKANLDSAGVMSADDKKALQDHGNSISQLESTTSGHSNAISQINAKLDEHTESINAKIATDRIEDGAVTSEKIATSAFDSTLSVSGKIAPADVVGEKLNELECKVEKNSSIFGTETVLSPTFTEGYYVNAVEKNISTNNSYKYAIIDVSAGTTVIVYCAGLENVVSAISLKMDEVYVPLCVTDTSAEKFYSYTFVEDCIVAVSGRIDKDFLVYKIDNNLIKEIIAPIHMVSANKVKIDKLSQISYLNSIVEESVSFSGGYVNANSQQIANIGSTSYCYSSEIILQAGDFLLVKANGGVKDVVSVISAKINDTSYDILDVARGDFEDYYFYLATEEVYVVVSGRVNTIKVYKGNNKFVSELCEKIANNSTDITTIKNSLYKEESVDVDGVIGTGIVFGSSINNNIVINTSNPNKWKHKVFEIEEDKEYNLVISRYPGGGAYQYAVCNVSDKVLWVKRSDAIFNDTSATNVIVPIPKLAGQKKIYACYLPDTNSIPSVNYEKQTSVFDNQFSELNLLVDNDSMNGWVQITANILGLKSYTKNGTGGARCLDYYNYRGNITTPQWLPDVGDDWKDYASTKDPNLPGGNETYPEGSAEWQQANANNCLYGHLGKLIYCVSNGIYPKPDIFILNIMGVNDTWDLDDVSTKLGTIQDAMQGDWESIQRTTILRSLRWYIVKFKKTFPNCPIFFKTSSQQETKVRHKDFARVEEPVLELMRQLSVPVIDSYGECGICADLESYDSTQKGIGCMWTIDGTHPNAEGYKKDGKYVANKLKNIL